jgi:hypothetical protein
VSDVGNEFGLDKNAFKLRLLGFTIVLKSNINFFYFCGGMIITEINIELLSNSMAELPWKQAAPIWRWLCWRH